MKFRYRIEAGSRGGDLVICKVPENFVENFIDHDQNDLADVVRDDEGVTWIGGEPYDLPQIENEFSAVVDEDWYVYKVPNDKSEDWGYNEEDIVWYGEPNHITSRECYVAEDKKTDNCIPVLNFYSSEKGDFGAWFLDSDEEFDEDKLSFLSVETDTCELVERAFYNKKELELDQDWISTSGKGSYAKVGWLNPEWHDKKETYTVEYMEEEGFFDDD